MPVLLALLLLFLATPALADEPKPDDAIALSLSSEDWVTAATARVQVSVNASISGDRAAGARATMRAAVSILEPKADWKITSFSRGQDSSGLEQWVVVFETRLPEVSLGGLNDKAKTASKPGMQLAVINIDFTPTLAEMEAVRAALRKNILAQAAKELESVNAALPGRNYRIAEVRFGGMQVAMPPVGLMAKRMMMSADASTGASMEAALAPSPMETAQRIQLSADVVLAAVAPPSAK